MEPSNLNWTYLLSELARLDQVLLRAVRRKTDPALDRDGVCGLLEMEDHATEHSLARERWAPPAADQPRPMLLLLAECFGLTPFDLDILLLALAPELDRKYEQIYGFLNDDLTRSHPTVALALDLHFSKGDAWLAGLARFQPEAPLIRHGLLETVDVAPPTRLARGFVLEAGSRDFLLGIVPDEAMPVPYLRRLNPQVDLADLPLPAAIRERFIPFFLAETESLPRVACVHLHGPTGVGKAALAAGLATHLGLRLLVVDLDQMSVLAGDSERAVRRIFREAILGQALLYLHKAEILDEGPGRELRMYLTSALAEYGLVCLIAAEKPVALFPDGEPDTFMQVPFPSPDFATRNQCWRRALTALGPRFRNDFATEPLADRFKLTPATIHRTVLHAARLAVMAGCEQVGEHHILRACHNQARGNLGRLARKIEPGYDWPDIVLPHESLAHLREIRAQMTHRHRVLRTWGFARKSSANQGLTVLFAGPSGTGKTMASEILARALGLELYKIDLSSMVDKYIGETEKNLETLFREAERSDAILFFDEADAIFGKRTELKDAHDRYANLEVSYLLQRIEAYDGVVILASNFRKNIDEAFLRRFRYVVDFPLPNQDHRRQIWQGVFPETVPRAESLDFEFLAARFELSGGNIHNTALNAVYLAASSETGLTMEHIILALKREYQKLGRICAPADFGPYYELIHQPA